MAGLKDLKKLVDDGLVNIGEIKKRHSNPKTGNEIAEIANKLIQSVISDYHVFVYDQGKSLSNKAEKISSEIDSAIANINKKAETANADLIEVIAGVKEYGNDLVKVAQDAKMELGAIAHAEKERILTDTAMLHRSIKEKIVSGCTMVDDLLSQAKEMKDSMETSVESLQTVIANGQQYIEKKAGAVADKLNSDIFQEKIAEKVVEYVAMNFGKIIVAWIKSLFRVNGRDR